MKTTSIALAVALTSQLYAGEPATTQPVGKTDYGEFSGRIQYLGMYRDFEISHGHASTLGFVLGYQSPEFGGFDLGFAYNYAATLFDGGNTALPANDDINVLNEGWLRYTLGGDDTATSITAGRQIINSEVFRADDYRQKARAVEAFQITTKSIPNTRLTVGHSIRLSNWIDAGDRWDFNDFGDVFGVGYDTDGITWMELDYTGIANLKLSGYDAYAWDVCNLVGTRIEYEICDEAAIIGYYRHESDVGRGVAHNADVYGLSLRQKVGQVTLESGYFGVRGDDLYFQEATTGINHPLGVSMMIRGCQFNEGSDTAFIKAVTKINKTVLYALYSHTWLDTAAVPFDCQELNVVVKHPITDELTIAFKGGIADRDGKRGTTDNFATDARIFLTYKF